MSLGEIFIVIIIAILVMKPQDIPIIIGKFYKLKEYINQFKIQLRRYFTEEINLDDDKAINNLEEVNFYIQKILEMGETYQGEYSLDKIKDKYQQLLQEKIIAEKNNFNQKI